MELGTSSPCKPGPPPHYRRQVGQLVSAVARRAGRVRRPRLFFFFTSDAAPRELRKTTVACRNLSVRGYGWTLRVSRNEGRFPNLGRSEGAPRRASGRAHFPGRSPHKDATMLRHGRREWYSRSRFAPPSERSRRQATPAAMHLHDSRSWNRDDAVRCREAVEGVHFMLGGGQSHVTLVPRCPCSNEKGKTVEDSPQVRRAEMGGCCRDTGCPEQ